MKVLVPALLPTTDAVVPMRLQYLPPIIVVVLPSVDMPRLGLTV